MKSLMLLILLGCLMSVWDLSESKSITQNGDVMQSIFRTKRNAGPRLTPVIIRFLAPDGSQQAVDCSIPCHANLKDTSVVTITRYCFRFIRNRRYYGLCTLCWNGFKCGKAGNNRVF